MQIIRITLTLTDEEVERLDRPVVGQGGWQSLLRYINTRRVGFDGRQVEIDDPVWIERLFRYRGYGEAGGWQMRIGA